VHAASSFGDGGRRRRRGYGARKFGISRHAVDNYVIGVLKCAR
jgi:hypothetical protein